MLADITAHTAAMLAPQVAAAPVAQPAPQLAPTPFVQNPYLNRQMAGSGASRAVPPWVLQSYQNKMGRPFAPGQPLTSNPTYGTQTGGSGKSGPGTPISASSPVTGGTM